MKTSSSIAVRRLSQSVALTAGALVLVGCQNDAGQGSNAADIDCGDPASEITVAYQPGIGYGNLRMAEADGTFEDGLDGVAVQWTEMNSGAAIRDGVLSEDIDIAAAGVGPFIIGADSGVGWRMISSLNSMNLQLMTMDEEMSLEDLADGDASIAMPGPDSIQSVVLRKAAQDELGDAEVMDSQIVAMGHPDGAQALIAGQLGGHLTSPPFQQQIADEGGHVLLDSFDVMGGPHTFNGVYAQEEFIECNPDVAPALIDALEGANSEISEDPETAAEKIQTELGDIDIDLILNELEGEDTEFTTTPENVEVFSEFMNEIGLVSDYLTSEDLFFDNDATSGGN